MLKNTNTVISILIGVIVILLILVAQFALKGRSQVAEGGTDRENTTMSQTPAPSVATQSPTPTEQPKNNVGRKITSIEEALEEARKLAKPYTVDLVKVSDYQIIHTPSSRQYEFTLYTRLNPVQADDYTAPEYDYKWIEFTIDNNGFYSMTVYEQRTMFQRYWDQYFDSQEITESDVASLVESANVRVESAGAVPGTVYIVDNQQCAVSVSCLKDIYVTVVLAGEEKKEKKQAKKVHFKDGAFYRIEDVELTLTSGN